MGFYMAQGNTSPALEQTLRDGAGAAVNLTGATVVFRMVPLEGGDPVTAAASIQSAEGGVVRYPWAAGDTDLPATYRVFWDVTFADLSTETFPNSALAAEWVEVAPTA